MSKRFISVISSMVYASLLTFSAGVLAEVNEAEIKSLLKRNDCTKCHAINKTKKGPSYEKIAEELVRKPSAEAEKFFTDSVTKGLKVKFKDGSEEEHKIIDTKDPEELKKLFKWIMSLSPPLAK